MIRLEPLTLRGNTVIAETWKESYSEDFLTEYEGGMVRLIRHDSIPCGLINVRPQDKDAILRIFFAPKTDQRRKLLAVVTERIIRLMHPEKIIIEQIDETLFPVYESNSYRREGDTYVKVIEPWRAILNDAVFDDEGFIINQGRMKEIPFGWFDTKAKGCGWISAYNLLKMNGMETKMEVCAHGLEKHSMMGKLMGQNLFTLFIWLKQQGLNVKMSLPVNGAALKMINETDSGIILYTHSRGAHYVTYRKLNASHVQIFNAVYGKRNHVMKASEFLKKYPLFPTTVVIGVPSKK